MATPQSLTRGVIILGAININKYTSQSLGHKVKVTRTSHVSLGFDGLSLGVSLWTLAGWRQLTGFHLLVDVYCL